MSVAGGPSGTDPWGGNGSDLDDSAQAAVQTLRGAAIGRGTTHQFRGNPNAARDPFDQQCSHPAVQGWVTSLATFVVQMYEAGTFGRGVQQMRPLTGGVTHRPPFWRSPTPTYHAATGQRQENGTGRSAE